MKGQMAALSCTADWSWPTLPRCTLLFPPACSYSVIPTGQTALPPWLTVILTLGLIPDQLHTSFTAAAALTQHSHIQVDILSAARLLYSYGCFLVRSQVIITQICGWLSAEVLPEPFGFSVRLHVGRRAFDSRHR